MELSSAVDSAVGDNGRGEGGPGTSVDMYASLCLCDNGKEKSQEVNRSRSPRLKKAHPQIFPNLGTVSCTYRSFKYIGRTTNKNPKNPARFQHLEVQPVGS